jgi:molybdate transport system regulatory protein
VSGLASPPISACHRNINGTGEISDEQPSAVSAKRCAGALRDSGKRYTRPYGAAHVASRLRTRAGIGHGKIRLLEALRDHGSILATGRSMGMSYRRAWLLVDELNRLFELRVVETKHGASAGGGAELTPFGHKVVQQYRTIEAKAHVAVADELNALAAATSRLASDTWRS